MATLTQTAVSNFENPERDRTIKYSNHHGESNPVASAISATTTTTTTTTSTIFEDAPKSTLLKTIIPTKENEMMSLKEASRFSMVEGTSLGQDHHHHHNHHHHSTSTSCCENNSSTIDGQESSTSNQNTNTIIESLNDSKCNIEKSENGKSKFLIYVVIGIFVVLISYLLVMMNYSVGNSVVVNNLSSRASILAKSGNNNLLNGVESVPQTEKSNITKKKEKKNTLSGLYKPEKNGIAKYIKPLEPKTRIIGRREMIHFPQLGVINLLAKVDSGAKTSCLDVANIRHNKTANTMSFDVVLDRHNRSIVQTILDFPFSNTTKTVMSSNGHISTRYVLKTIVSIGTEFQDQVAEFTLVERHKLACPVLIGRNIIRVGGFLVDCNKKFTTGKKQTTVVQEPIHIPNLVDYPIPSPPRRKKTKKKKKVIENQ